jgi:hypothetical protein
MIPTLRDFRLWPRRSALLEYYAANIVYLHRRFLVTTATGFILISWPLKMVPIGWPETSVRNYHFKLSNIPEERRYDTKWNNVRHFWPSGVNKFGFKFLNTGINTLTWEVWSSCTGIRASRQERVLDVPGTRYRGQHNTQISPSSCVGCQETIRYPERTAQRTILSQIKGILL